MRKISLFCFALFFIGVTGVKAQQNSGSKKEVELNYAIGADLSFLKMAEDSRMVFKDDGESKPGLQIFKNHGYNWIRLRLFHSPDRLPND